MEDDTPFKSCAITDLYCQDINDNRKISHLTDIKEYDVVVKIDYNYKIIKKNSLILKESCYNSFKNEL